MFKLSNIVWLLAASSLALSLSVEEGYSIPPAILFFISIFYFLLKQYKSKLKVSLSDKVLIYTFTAYALAMFLFVYLDGWYIRELDRPSRFLISLPILLLLLKSPLPQKPILFHGVVLGAISSLFVALHDRFILHLPRAKGGENEIMFGDISMMLGFLSCAALMYFYHKKQTLWAIISLVAVLAGVAASLLSGSRGGWVAAPLIVVFLLWQSRELFPKKALAFGVSGFLVVLVMLISLPQTGVQNRIESAFSDLKLYQTGDSYSSVGLRLDMWKSSLYLLADAPLFGTGQYGSHELRSELAEQGIIHPRAAKFDHLHNEYLTSLGFYGVLGFIFLMAAYLVPLQLFMRSVKNYSHNWEIKPYAIAGALVPMCYMDFALTQSMFSHNIGVMLYIFPILFFWAALRWKEKNFA